MTSATIFSVFNCWLKFHHCWLIIPACQKTLTFRYCNIVIMKSSVGMFYLNRYLPFSYHLHHSGNQLRATSRCPSCASGQRKALAWGLPLLAAPTGEGAQPRLSPQDTAGHPVRIWHCQGSQEACYSLPVKCFWFDILLGSFFLFLFFRQLIKS